MRSGWIETRSRQAAGRIRVRRYGQARSMTAAAGPSARAEGKASEAIAGGCGAVDHRRW